MSVDNSRLNQSEKHARARIAAGFDVAVHAVITGGEARCDAKPLRARPLGEAEAWRDGWRAAMACAVLVAETARAPVAVDLLREQLEPPV